MIPYFIDVDADSWALEGQTVLSEIKQAPAPVGAVMPVAPFGRPLSIAAWDAFRTETGLPVVIDAAAGFDSLVPATTPAVVSLHATKILATGEGGFVVSNDPSIIASVRARSNFGFAGGRESVAAAANAKMSEYHAALGHAGLDEWTDTRGEWMRAAAEYRDALGASNKVRLQDGFGQSWVSSTCVLHAADSAAARIETALAAAGIDTRRWWGTGAHAHPATARFPRTDLPVTEALANSTIAVPFYRDLAPDDIRRIAAIVLAAA
jgi:dTDP-4-amino-4,6-dideoxygalactose transaminase